MNQRTILICIAILITALVALYINNENPSLALTTITLAIATTTVIITSKIADDSAAASEKSKELTVKALNHSEETARKTHEQTEKSLKMTELIMKKSDTEREIRHLEDSLQHFYYPLRIYLNKDSNRYDTDLAYVAQHRYLAIEQTRLELERFIMEGPSPIRQRPLSNSVDIDIESIVDALKTKKIQLESYSLQISTL
jgi:hypothetical protein